MILENLVLTNYKNYSNEKFEFSSEINCFVGQNGSGKTNILDAIYFLAMTKSNFQSKDKILLFEDSYFFTLSTKIQESDSNHDVFAAFQTGKRKNFKFDEIPYKKPIEHVGKIPLVFVTPYDTDVIRESSETRRKFFDQLFCQLDHEYLVDLVKYQNLVKSRNALMKQFKDKDYFDKDLLATFDNQLFPLNISISKKRKKFTDGLKSDFIQFYNEITQSSEVVNLDYQTTVDDNIRVAFQENIQKDRILCRTSVGIHKDDFIFKLNDNPIRDFGSQGQQKSYIMALQLAKFEELKKLSNKKPLLLLDDIFDKLDENRIAHLMKLIGQKRFGQIFITDTNANRLKTVLEKLESKVKYFHISEGQITKSEE